jgi:hypothetical protein
MAEAIGSGGNITLNASNLSLVLPLSEAGDSARYFKAAAQKIGQFFIDVSRMTKENLYS